MRVVYRQLLYELPLSTLKKVPPQQLNTQQGRALAITQLVSKHSGEVVELDPRTQDWRLFDLTDVPASGRFFFRGVRADLVHAGWFDAWVNRVRLPIGL